FRETRFFWRPGFWVPYREGWVWVPDRYYTTPAGCVFVEGYWDHPLAERGLLFAPVRVEAVVRERRRPFVPASVVEPDFLLGCLFVRTTSRTYYFGDYFEERHVKAGFTPWVDYRVTRTTYDANFEYYRREYRTSEHWERGL